MKKEERNPAGERSFCASHRERRRGVPIHALTPIRRMRHNFATDGDYTKRREEAALGVVDFELFTLQGLPFATLKLRSTGQNGECRFGTIAAAAAEVAVEPPGDTARHSYQQQQV